MRITELSTFCNMYFVRDDKNEDAQSMFGITRNCNKTMSILPITEALKCLILDLKGN